MFNGPLKCAYLLGALAASGCVLKNAVVDQAQVDSMTFCEASKSPLDGERWGRVEKQSAATRESTSRQSAPGRAQAESEVWWSHYSLGEFPCKTQNEWLCQARTGSAGGCDAWGPIDTVARQPGRSGASDGATTRQYYRNETQSEMLLHSDRLCDRHLASNFGTQAGYSLGLDLFGSLFSGVSSLTTGNTARNLSAGSAFFGATKSHISADVYQGQVSTAINLIIRKNRNAARAIIRNNQGCSSTQYSAADAVQEALVYHNMCSFEYGLSELVREASDSSPIRGNVAASELARLQQALTALETRRAAATDAAQQTALDKDIAAVRAKIDVYGAFGIVEPLRSTAAPAPPPGSPDGVAPSPADPDATANASVPAPSIGTAASSPIEARACSAN